MSAKIIIGVVVVGVGGYFAYKAIKKAQAAKKAAADAAAKKTTTTTTQTQNQGSGFPLKQGSTGPYVTELQTYLKTVGKFNIAIDGSFGPATEAALYKATNLTQIATLDQYNALKSNISNVVLQEVAPPFGSNEYFQGIWNKWF